MGEHFHQLKYIMSQDEEITFETTIDILDTLFVKGSWDKCIEYINRRQSRRENINFRRIKRVRVELFGNLQECMCVSCILDVFIVEKWSWNTGLVTNNESWRFM